MSRLAPLLLILAPLAATAEGFALDDLRRLDADGALLGAEWQAEATGAQRLTYACVGCDPLAAVDVVLGRQDDGTEDRVRSGETTMESLEALCQSRDPSCTLERVDVGPAAGWVTTYRGTFAGSTTVLLRDGDMLTIRAIAGDPATARGYGDRVRDAIAAEIIGD
ncbi:hypothetical protein [Jannaschia marina]|uniref:hypothetical protein n=1 Tax=Jannaschia marina TaxID=2741674 RepID=UPI0015C707E2|nr:hypothetical protein [Jannaschia marina]